MLEDEPTHTSDSSSVTEGQSRSQTQEEDLRPLPDVIGRARQWIERCEAEESRLETLPAIWGKRLRKAAPEIENLFRTEATPVMAEAKRYMNEDVVPDREDRWTIFDGALAKISMKLRSGLKRIMRAPRTENRRVRIGRSTTATITNAKRLIDMMRRLYESRRMPRTQARQTAESQLTEWITRSLEQIDGKEQLVAVLGTEEVDTEGIMADDREHFEARMKYLEDSLRCYEREARGTESSTYKNMIQSMYNEDPNRVLKHMVFKDTHEECALTVDQIVSTYGEAAARPETYDDAGNEFEIRRCLEDADTDYIWAYITDENNIKATLRSRSNLSAQGPDAISYAVWKSGGEETVHLLQWIISEMKEFERFPTSWKKAKTVVVPKDGDPHEPRNWRPITITSTAYRVVMCLISRAMQSLNSAKKFINDQQHGFTKTPNGAMMHIGVINELIKHADRTKTAVYMMSIDLRDAFGSVSHDLIRYALRAKGFGEGLIKMIMDAYKNATTRYVVNGGTSDPLFINRGVRQGCPLAPALFNLCIEGLLEKLVRQKEDGVKIGDAVVAVQAYADDLILISDTEEGLRNLATTLERFCLATRLDINVNKCKTLSYIVTPHTRVTADVTFKLRGQPVPTMSLMDYIEYLGCPIAVTKEAKMEHARDRILDAGGLVNRVRMSQLSVTQTLDSIKRFIIPRLDYELANGICPKTDLQTLDRIIRCAIQDLVGHQSMPMEFFYSAWKDGGLGLPKLDERMAILQIRTFMNMMQASNLTVRRIFDECIKSEAALRRIPLDQADRWAALRIPIDDNARANTGTSNLLARFLYAQRDIGIRVLPYTEERRSDDEVSSQDRHSGDETQETYDWLLKPVDEEEEMVATSDRDLLKELTRMLRERHQRDLTSHPLRGHSFVALKDCPISNYFLATGNTKPKDNLVKFAILARTNSLHTGQVRRLASSGQVDGECRCGQLESLAHILNGCVYYKQKYTGRHNAIVDLVWEMIREAARPQTLTPHFNSALLDVDEDENVRRLRPDLWYRKGGTLHVVEVTVPYATPSHGENTLETRRREKLEKYEPLMTALRRRPGAAAELHVIVIGSLGAIPKSTIKELEKLAPAALTRRYAKRMTAAAILGSRLIYLESRRSTQTTTNQGGTARTTSGEGDTDSSDSEAKQAEATVDQREEEGPTPQPARDDTDELVGTSGTLTDSDSDSIEAGQSDDSDTDDGSVVYWMSRGSTANGAGMQ